MSNKKITDLNYYSASQVQSYDLLFITDIQNQETKKIEALELANYISGISGSAYRSGSFMGTFNGTASVALELAYPNNSTASYSISSSHADVSDSSVSSSYALTASYALNGGSGGGSSVGDFTETITQVGHGFSIGDAIYEVGVDPNRSFYKANSLYGSPGSGDDLKNEVVGIVKSTSSADIFTVSYGGLVDFGSTPPSYFGTVNGIAYFLSGSNGKLSTTDPSIVDTTHISKPILLKVSSTKAYIINQRGLYDTTGEDGSTADNAISASYGLTSSYALTASYALNGGGGGGTTAVTEAYYIDTMPVGSIIALASSETPTGYLPCDGTYYLRSSYPDLVTEMEKSRVTYTNSEIGKRYSQINLTTFQESPSGLWFKVPDIRGVFVRGYNNNTQNGNSIISAYDTSRNFGSTQNDALKAHTHTTNMSLIENYNYIGTNFNTDRGGGSNGTRFGEMTISSTGDVETRPVNIALNYFIKVAKINLNSAQLQSIANGTYTIGGDVQGTLIQSVVSKIQGVSVASTSPQTNNILQYNGSQWAPNTFNGVSISTTPSAGDLIQYNGSQWVKLSPNAKGDIIQFNGSQWEAVSTSSFKGGGVSGAPVIVAAYYPGIPEYSYNVNTAGIVYASGGSNIRIVTIPFQNNIVGQYVVNATVVGTVSAVANVSVTSRSQSSVTLRIYSNPFSALISAGFTIFK